MKWLYKTQCGTHLQRPGWIAVLVAGTLLLAGCAVGPKYRAPSVPTPPAYKELTPFFGVAASAAM